MGTKRSVTAESSPWVTLNDAATITIDASKGNNFQVTIGGNRTFANPTNPTDGQVMLLKVMQGAIVGLITWGSAFRFGSILGNPTLSIISGKSDYITFIYNSAAGTWDNIAYQKGF